MAWLQFLTGGRANELVELNPAATLILGSSGDAHIQILDSEIAPNHCQVYPAQNAYWLQDLGQGATILNMRRLAQETEGLQEHDVFIVGRTFMRFCTQRPAAGGASPSSMGIDPSALDAAQREISALKEEVDRLRTWGSKGEELTDTLTEKLTEAKERMEKVRRQLQERDDEIHSLRSQRGESGKQATQLEQQLGDALSELRELKEKRKELEQAVVQQEGEIEESRKERETARVDAKRLKLELGILEQQSEEDKKKVQQEAEGQVGKVRTELERLQARLESSQAALESLGVQRSGDLKVTSKDTGLDAAMQRLGLKPTQQAALEDALVVHVDAESLRRFAGPALTWDPPESEEQIRRARSLRGRAERVELAISLGIDPPK